MCERQLDGDRWLLVLALGLSAGAPPDLLFKEGQNWGFPPLHPDRARESGHRYLRASFHHIFRHADIVRIDRGKGGRDALACVALFTQATALKRCAEPAVSGRVAPISTMVRTSGIILRPASV